MNSLGKVLSAAVFAVVSTGTAWGNGPATDTSPERARTDIKPGFERIGTIRPRGASEIAGSNWTLGCETLDRDFAIYDEYKAYLVPLGIKTIRLQGGWAKTEKVRGVYDFAWLDTLVDDARGRGLNILLETDYGNPLYKGGGGADLAGGFPTSEESLAAWDRWVEAMASHRPYRQTLGIDAALAEVRGGAGTRYDAEVVAACERVIAAGFVLDPPD